ncbi:MAG: TIM barrel protein [Acetobacteraceae bacterium]
MQYALNHSIAPDRRFREFARIARAVDLADVEIRNDLPGIEIADRTPAAVVRRVAEDAGVRIATINALQRFDEWDDVRAGEARRLASYARECGVGALVLCPVNDTADSRTPMQRDADLRRALKALLPILRDAGISGLVEPLGFPQSALRTKSAALAAIGDVGAGEVFSLLHDSFHHFLSGETEFYPAQTGLVHISGVDDRRLSRADMKDEDRVLVGPDDALDTVGQLRALVRGGYRGLISVETFAPRIQAIADLGAALSSSLAGLTAAIGAA